MVTPVIPACRGLKQEDYHEFKVGIFPYMLMTLGSIPNKLGGALGSTPSGGWRCYFKINTGKYNRSLSRCVSPNVAQRRETFQDDLRLLR